MSDYYNSNTDRVIDRPRELPGGITQPTDATLASHGIYPCDPVPDLAEGMSRRVVWTVIDGRAVPECFDVSQADIDAAAATQRAIEAAAQEAADAERRSRPIVYDQPLECPMIVLQSHHLGKGIALVATDDLDIVPIVMHESPWPDKATADARIAGALAKRRADRDVALKDINGQIQKRLENIERLLGLRA